MFKCEGGHFLLFPLFRMINYVIYIDLLSFIYFVHLLSIFYLNVLIIQKLADLYLFLIIL